MVGHLRREWTHLRVQLGQPCKLMALGGQLFEPVQGVAVTGLAVPQPLRLLQLLGGALVLFLQFAQRLEPDVLLLQLFELALSGLELLLGQGELLIQFEARVRRQGRNPHRLIL